ncbi:phage tail tape measure protein [Ferruginibacter yonginensis]|uniref:Phage tail tape measure protein n=1 Tax=Ferruginibacter yonginensis TaxID=1310416 RepID=A0ABV8QQB6_9BACT
MSEGLQYHINFTGNAVEVLRHVNEQLGDTMTSAKKATTAFKDTWQSLLAFNQVVQSIDAVKQSLQELNAPGISLNANMQELSAITGVTGKGLDAISDAARQSAKAFGTDASQNLESYKVLLSKLDPEIAKNNVALKAMGDSVNVLSKSMAGDTVAATTVLTTAMNQFGVSTEDPIAASNTMAEMMNIMAAAAQAGSAELPQIGEALEKSGMQAKLANISFAETNAAIQVLDKAGAKGSEGGTALRNITAILSEGRFMPKEAREALQSAGISVEALGDKSKTLKERLQLLQPILNDSALLGKVFGRENEGAAIALINGTEKLGEYTKAITGTNSAVEQANVVMQSYEERQKRTQAAVDDMKISFFNATESIQPYLQSTMSVLSEVGKLGAGVHALSSVFNNQFTKSIYDGVKGLFTKTVAVNADTASLAGNTVAMGAASVSGGIFSGVMQVVKASIASATTSVQGFSLSLSSIPVIGWIAAAVTAVVIAFKYLWDHSKAFREQLYGIWEAAKAVFHNIGVVIQRLYNAIIKPIVQSITEAFNWLYEIVSTVFNGVVDVVAGAFDWIYEKVSMVLNGIGNFFKGLWDWFSNLFSGFIKIINEWIIDPIKNAFNGLMDFLLGIFNWIGDKLKALIQPLIDMYNYIFGDEGMENVNKAYENGLKKGGESFDKDNPAVKEAQSSVTQFASETNFKATSANNFGGASAIADKKTAIKGAGAAAAKTNSNSSASSRNINQLTINKLVENIVIHTTNLNETKEKIKQVVIEALLTGVSDFTLANN